MTRRRWILTGAAATGIWVLACSFLLLRAASDLRAGETLAREARDHLDAEAITEGEATGPLRRAAARLDRAAVGLGHPLLAPVRLLPIVGRQLRSAKAIATSVAAVADAAADGVGALEGVLDGRGLAGSDRVEQLRTLHAAVVRVEERVREVDDLGPSAGLIAPLARARDEVASELDEAKESLADARAGTGLALDLLQGPRRYLLVAGNNAEMRGGSGMWLSGGVLTTEAGVLTLGSFSPIYDYVVPEGAVTPTGDLAARWGWLRPGVEWRNLMASPGFPASAELASQMFVAAGQGVVDGVLVLDPIGLRALVASTGPIEVDGETITAEQLVEDLLHGQYDGIDAHDDRETGERRDRLGKLTSAIFEKLEAGEWSPSTLARELGDAVKGRHILAWSPDPEEQAGWDAAGMSGSLTPSSLAISLLNTGGNKLDWFTGIGVDLTVDRGVDRTSVRLSITITNATPEGEAGYVAGPHPALEDLLDPGDYRGVLAVNLPETAGGIVLEGVERIDVQGPDGPTWVVGSTVVIRQGEAKELVLSFTMPGRVGSMLVEPSARVPPVEWHYGGDRWQDNRRRTVNW